MGGAVWLFNSSNSVLDSTACPTPWLKAAQFAKVYRGT